MKVSTYFAIFSTREVYVSLLFEMLRAVVWRKLKGCCSVGRRSEGPREGGAFPMVFQGLAYLPPSVLVFGLSVRVWMRLCSLVSLYVPEQCFCVLNCSSTAEDSTVLSLSPSSTALSPPSITFLSSPLSFCLPPYFSFQQDEDYWVRKNFKWFIRTLCVILKVNPEDS